MSQTDKSQLPINDPYFDDIKAKTGFSFDFVLWFYRILKYWYLFAIAIITSLILANIESRKGVDTHQISALLMLEARGDVSPVAGVVPLGSIIQNTANQQIVLKSRGLVEQTVENLPKKMWINYFRKTRFKRFTMYGVSPVEVQTVELTNAAYVYTYNIAYVDNDHCQVFYEETEYHPSYSIVVPFNKVIDNGNFKIVLKKTKHFVPDFDTFSFQFLNKDQMIGTYYGRVNSKLVNEKATALDIAMIGQEWSKDIDYLTAFLDEFQNYNLSLKNSQATLTIDFIDKQLVIINDSLENSRIALDRFQRETGVYAISTPTLRDEVREADKEIEKLRLREKAILIVADRLATAIRDNTEMIDPQMFGLEEPTLSANVKAYNAALKSAQYVGVKSPTFERVASALNEQRRLLLTEMQQIVARNEKEKEQMRVDYMETENEIENLPPLERQLVKYQRVYALNEMYQRFLTQRKYEAQIQKASNTSDNFVLEWPRRISTTSSGGSADYLSYLIIGILIPLIFVILKEEVLNFTISSKEECERLSGYPVIGTIENVSKKLGKGVTLVKNYPKSSFAESFRNMRVRIEYMARKENHITILITSTEPADGKTFIATNIASVYQLLGKKVIIVDLDLRRPSVAKTLQIPNNKGVSNYLIGQVTLDEIIVSNPSYGFDIITAGTLPPNPSELIRTEKTRELIKHLQSVYDYVIIDCSPVGLVSDAYILGKIVDTSLFVVRRAKTSKSFFKSVITQVRTDGIENVALVFNDVKGREGYYGTSRYYGDRTYYLRKKSSYYHDDYFED
ncbi:tyrosine-protein kinase family protein [Dysgonomonas sp. 25]|uniref:tyrosine-protein kinase family protein n=1 Tax=Dysgonomonas sp. 25 TaxID=2302933 RepID=UPI0013D4AD87|nr:tyrosine-protein kinase family protein [Dysgonomonas sp. 25]NDV68746.1 polysaccharide biosynthesis tyrosine autokinase [Dysgonomonas sp. 25]